MLRGRRPGGGRRGVPRRLALRRPAGGRLHPAGGRLPAGDVTKQIQALAGALAADPPELARTGDITTKGDVATARVKVRLGAARRRHLGLRESVRLSAAATTSGR
ncbi:hypothetical protein V2I01_06250 [Micromonospora sp. BRA006-A]|nr:hypothetical protein [Micromonospora sp. BRA006-A]